MKTVLLTALVSLVGILTSVTQAQIIPLTIDSAQSSFTVSLDGVSRSSQLSGTTTIDLQSTSPPSGMAQITDLNLVADDGLSFSFFFGVVRASTAPGDVTLSLVTPGSASTISGNSFNQLGNLLALGGDLFVIDPAGLAGGSQTVDLSTITISPTDFNSISVTQSGNDITISGSFSNSQTSAFGLLELDATFVATGVVPSVLKGDIDMDSDVDFNDISPFISVLQSGGFQAEADCDCSGVVDFGDIPAFIAILQMQ